MNTIKLSLAALLLSTVAFTSCKKKGCMDEAAVNYDDKAKKDNGTCNYKPVITIVGANPATVHVGATYNDAGATAFVKNTGAVDVTTDLSNVNTSQTGNFVVTYSASNSHGTTTATRSVYVVLGQSSYLGAFGATNTCGTSDIFPHTSTPQVLPGNGPNQVKIDNAFNVIGGTIIMNINEQNITVPSTTINLPLGAGTLNFSGSGTMNNTGSSMVVNYAYTRTGLLSGTGNCTVTYTR